MRRKTGKENIEKAISYEFDCDDPSNCICKIFERLGEVTFRCVLCNRIITFEKEIID